MSVSLIQDLCIHLFLKRKGKEGEERKRRNMKKKEWETKEETGKVKNMEKRKGGRKKENGKKKGKRRRKNKEVGKKEGKGEEEKKGGRKEEKRSIRRESSVFLALQGCPYPCVPSQAACFSTF